MSSRLLALACAVVMLLALPFPAAALQFTGSANDNNGNFHYIGKFSYGVAPQNAPVGNFEVQVQTQQVGLSWSELPGSYTAASQLPTLTLTFHKGGLTFAAWDDEAESMPLARSASCDCVCELSHAKFRVPIINVSSKIPGDWWTYSPPTGVQEADKAHFWFFGILNCQDDAGVQ